MTEPKQLADLLSDTYNIRQDWMLDTLVTLELEIKQAEVYKSISNMYNTYYILAAGKISDYQRKKGEIQYGRNQR